MRRRFLALAAGFACFAAWPKESVPPPPSQRSLEDFDAMWTAVDSRYGYIAESREAWKRARATWRPRAAAAKTDDELVLALEGALAFLHDDAVTVSGRAADSARRVPAESDIWAEWRDGAARVTAVRPFGEADVAGLLPGHVVTHVNGRPVENVLQDRLRAVGAKGGAAMDWALRHVLAGPRSGLVKLAVRNATEAKTITIERALPTTTNGPPLLARRMGEERDLAYIRIRNTLRDPSLPTAFDAALNYLKDTKALLLDLRETMDGGRSEVAGAILNRLSGAEATYRGGIVVLVDRWTAGEGESLAGALQERTRAAIVGTPTAGLRGPLAVVTLPRSGIAVSFPSAKAAREPLNPSLLVDLAAPSGGPGDPILYQALRISPLPARADRTGPR